MTELNTQQKRVLRALRASTDGVTQHDFNRPTRDGGDAIERVAARIYELKRLGYPIEKARDEHGKLRRRSGHHVYTLAFTAPAAVEDALDEPGRLFDPPGSRPRGAYDLDAA